MEQAINQFTKGLQLDTHPMVQGNDTLTDCLNGTLITMSGDEVILQNDMGNRRVDQAFLHAGYEPVGIKEYGGIIYIAAYNPITNQSQIGCFPSPQRKYTYGDNNSGVNLDLDDNGFDRYKFTTIQDIENNNVNIYAITSDTILVKLINKPLCPGDKFLTVVNDDCRDKVSNWGNVEDQEEKPYKNKQYTLSYGILNSQNQFVDITKDLMRWGGPNGDTIVENYGNNETNFNKGYFLPWGTPTSIEDEENNEKIYPYKAINDDNFDKERLKLEMNTYFGKLIGYPYIKVKLNHPVSFSYSHKGRIVGDDAELTIVGTIKYNCPIERIEDDDEEERKIFMLFESKHPHIVINNSNSGIQVTVPNDQGNPTQEPNDDDYPLGSRSLSRNNDNNDNNNNNNPKYTDIYFSGSPELVPDPKIGTNFNNETYDSVLDLFTITVEKTYTIDKDEKFNGYLGVPVSDNYIDYIVGNLIQPISIDPALFGTNKLYLSSFGWKKENNKLYIRYNIDNYLYDDFTINKIRIGLKDLTLNNNVDGLDYNYNSNANFSYQELSNDTGGTNIELLSDLDNLNNLINRHYYQVTFEYKTSEDPDNWKTIDNLYNSSTNSNGLKLWILNTPLLNDCYDYLNKEYYIVNYCNRTYKEEEIFKKLTVIEYEDESDYIQLNPVEEISGNNISLTNFWSLTDKKFNLSFEHNTYTKITVNKNFKIKNEKNYPADIGDVSADITIKNEEYENKIYEDFIKGTLPRSVEEGGKMKIITKINLDENQNIELHTKFYDFFISDSAGQSKLVNASNCMFPIRYLLDEIVVQENISESFGPVVHVNNDSNDISDNRYKVCATLIENNSNPYNWNITPTTTNNGIKLGVNAITSIGKLIGYRRFDHTIFLPYTSPDIFPSYNNYDGRLDENYDGISNACAYAKTLTNNNNGNYLMNTSFTSYIYMLGPDSKILVLSDYLNDNNENVLPTITSIEWIKKVLEQYYGKFTRIFMNKDNISVYTAHRAFSQTGSNVIYTEIPEDRYQDKPIVTMEIEYEINHSYNDYKNNSNNTRKGCYFTSSKLENRIKECTINIKSYDEFLKNISNDFDPNVSYLDLTFDDIKEIIPNPSYKKRHLYKYNSGNNSYDEYETGFYRGDNNEDHKIPLLNYSNNEDIYCYIFGKYRLMNESQNSLINSSSRFFYVQFSDLSIKPAQKFS